MKSDDLVHKVLMKLPTDYARVQAVEQIPLEVAQVLPAVVDAIERMGKDPMTIFQEIIRRAEHEQR